jgi:hypothetical protein
MPFDFCSLFDIVEKISLDEYMFNQTALTNQNSETIFKCVFKLSHGDKDGLLTKS